MLSKRVLHCCAGGVGAWALMVQYQHSCSNETPRAHLFHLGFMDGSLVLSSRLAPTRREPQNGDGCISYFLFGTSAGGRTPHSFAVVTDSSTQAVLQRIQ